jgi:redox-sensitive bicupin YhaK (pirin superfamily)
MFEMRKSEDRGVGKLDWLDARFTFEFGPYKNPDQIGFSDLRLLNDDNVKGGGGFATHEHKDTEVFSYVLSGQLEHKDSMGDGSVVNSGDVLTMSAGTGITHSEFNHSKTDSVHFLQIWMVTGKKGVSPSYGQKHFPESEKRGKLRLIISPDGRDGSLTFHQDTKIYAGLLNGAEKAEVALGPNRYAYVHVISGKVSVNGQPFGDGDGARVRQEEKLVFSDGQNAEVLVFDMRPQERPEI